MGYCEFFLFGVVSFLVLKKYCRLAVTFFLRLRLAVTGETGGVQASARKDPGPLGSSLRFIFSDNILVIVIKNII